MSRGRHHLLRRLSAVAAGLMLVPMVSGTAAAFVGTTTISAQTPNPVVAGSSATYTVRVQNLGIFPQLFTVSAVSGATGLSLGSSTCVSIPALSSANLNPVVVNTTSATPAGALTITLRVTEYLQLFGCGTLAVQSRNFTTTLNVVGSQAITFGPLSDVTYGAGPLTLTATASSGLAVAYGTTGPCTATGSSLAITGTGTCAVTASQAGNASWAPATSVPQSFNIGPAALTVTAENKTKVQGDDNPALTAAIGGFVNGDDALDLTAQPTCTTTALPSSAVGDYPIACDGAASPNYTIGYVPGTLSVVPGALHHIVISPDSASIVAGATQAYTAEGFDVNGNTLGDVTAGTAFDIGGTPCAGAACGSNTAGNYTVTGTNGAITDTASLEVTGGGLDHLVISPNSSTIESGATQAYTVEGFDAFNNSLGDMTGSATFDIGGTPCSGTACGSAAEGDYTVTAAVGTLTVAAALHVNAPAPTTGPSASADPSPTSTEIVGGETANPTTNTTLPPTSTNGDPSGDRSLPLLVALIALALGGLGLLTVRAQAAAIRR